MSCLFDDAEIESLVKTPKKVQTDEGSVEERSVSDLIDADRYACNRSALTNEAAPFGIRVALTQPGGTVRRRQR